MGKQGQTQLVLVPCPFQGHITPMLQLGTILHSKGFSITILHTQFNSPNPSNHPDFNFLSIPDGLSDHVISSGDLVSLMLSLNINCHSPLKECLVRMMETQDTHDKFVCVIYDELMYVSESVANQLNLPSIILRTNTAATFLARGVLLQIIADGCIPLQDSLLQDPVPEHYPLRFKDLPTSNFGPLENFLKVVINARNVKTSSAIIWNTMDCIEKSSLAQIEKQCHVPIFALGPMHKIAPEVSSSLLKEDDICIPWLDKQAHNSVIYVSLGSVVSMDEAELSEMAWGLANSKQPFLWVVRPWSSQGSKRTELLPDGFKEAVGDRGCVVEWAPQKEVLAHSAVGGFWSHCGWNSTLESICEGVPMICRPSFGDQKVTARYVSHIWQVGLQLENELERKEVESLIRSLMVHKEGEEMRQRAKHLKEKAEICTKQSGSSYNSLEELAEFIISFNCTTM